MKVNQEEKVDRYGIYPHIRVSGKDANQDGRLSEDEINAVTSIRVEDCMDRI